MFGIAPSELMIVALVALVLIGPKDLPRALRLAGQWVGRGKAMSRHLRGTVDELIRQAEVSEHRRTEAVISAGGSSDLAEGRIVGDPPTG